KLAVAHDSSPYVTIYNSSDWSKIANPSTLPPDDANAVAFSPDGSKLAVGHLGSPYFTIYNTSDWTKMANPSTLTGFNVNGVAFGRRHVKGVWLSRVREDCSAHTEGVDCFTSLADWEASYGGFDFGTCPDGDLVCAK